MDIFIKFSLFWLAYFLVLVVFSLFKRSIPALKIQDAQHLFDGITKEFVNVSRVDEEDIRKIRARISHSLGFPIFTICGDILAIAGLVNMVKSGEVTPVCIGIYIGVLIVLSAICFYKGIQNANVFNNPDNFNKRNGIILDFKKIRVPRGPHGGLKPFYVYRVFIATYDDEEKPIAFKTVIPEFLFKAIQKNDKWYVIMYKGRPATIIKG